ncbi:MAG: gliding motility-associated C-terminal domain-containing protein [bacterium]|nr:gliding motility-associated C-terminal domain-containing protein [bacterium]
MKRKIKYHFVYFLILVSCVCFGQTTAQINPSDNSATGNKSSFVSQGDIFGTRVFIENKGQFNDKLPGGEKVLFVYDYGGEKIYFTNEGLVHEFVRQFSSTEQQTGSKERSEQTNVNPAKTSFVKMNWINSRQTTEVEGREKQNHYITYGSADLNSRTFKKILYKNVYNDIDIEYEIPENKAYGVKYSIILHPGSKAEDIKIAYSGDVTQIKLDKAGNLEVHSSADKIMEHAPSSFYRGGDSLPSGFVLNENFVSFLLPKNYKNDKTVIIDPWVTAISTFSVYLTNSNGGYDIDHDNFGNTYVYGATGQFKVAKYNLSGILQWTFSGIVASPFWDSGIGPPSGILVNKLTSQIYVAHKLWGQKVMRLDGNGNYDNFISTAISNPGVGIPWWAQSVSSDMDFTCTGDIAIFGSSDAAGQMISTTTGSTYISTYFQLFPQSASVVGNARDELGNFFVYFWQWGSLLNVGYYNYVASVAPSFTTLTWNQPSTFSVFNGNNGVSFPVGPISQAWFKCLAVNMSYLYYYDGYNVAAFSKSTGSIVASTTVPLNAREQGGIAVDGCNNVYVGGVGSVLCFNFNGTSFSTLTPIPLNAGTTYQNVYDLQLDRITKTLYVTGSGFVGTYSAINSLSCNIANQCACVQPIVSVNTNSTNCANVGTSTISIIGVPGPYTYSWTPGGVTGSVVGGVNPGTYTVSVTSTSCNVTASAITIYTAALPPYSLTVNSTSITCANLGSASVSINGIPGPFSYTWMPSAQTNSIASGLSPGIYTLNVFSPGCNTTFSTTTIFTSLIPLTGNVANSTSVLCNGASTGTGVVTNLSGGSGNQSYIWTNGTSTSTVPNPTNLSAGIWSVNVTDALTGCQINQSFFISQPPLLVLNLSSNTPTTCAGMNIAISGTNSGGTGGYTYTWTAGPALNTQTVSQGIAGIYIYTLNSTDANNCLTSNTIAIGFIQNPVLSVSDVSICPLTVGTLTVSGASSYTWNAAISLSVQGISFTASPVGSQQYTVAGTALGCTAAVTASIILHPLPIPFLTSNSPRCNGDILQLNAGGGVSFLWTGPLGFSSSTQNSFVNPASPSNSGVYNLTVTSVNACTASTSASLIVNPTPTLSALGSTVCTTQSMTLNGFADPGSSYFWSGPIGYSSNQQNPVLQNPSLTRSGVYLLKVSSAVGCTNVATATVSVIPPPSLTVALSSPSLCYQAFNGSPNSITLTSGGANTYTLFTPNLIGSSQMGGGTASLVSVPPPGTSITIGTATLMGSNGVCASSATSTFAVIPNPTVGINSYTPVICAGQSFTYTSFGAQSYTWSQTTPGLTTYTTYMTVANPTVTSIYSVYGGSIGCNSPTQTTTITVYPLPTLTLSPINPKICLNDKITLSANGTGTSYSWLPVIAISNSAGTSVVANPLSAMNYSVIASANNCTTMAKITVSVLPLPIPTITALSQSICLNEIINLEGFGGVYYNWKGPGEITFEGKTVNLLASNLVYGGIYTLTVQDINTCRNSTSIPITVNNLPNGALLGLKENGCVPLCSNYEFSPNGSTQISSSWEINKQIISGSKFSYCFNQAGTFTITGRLYDPQSTCKNNIDFYVTVKPKPEADFQYSPLKPIENLDEVIFTNTSKGEKQIQWNWYFNDNRGYKSKTENTSYLYANAGEYPVAFIVRNTWGCMDTVMKTIVVEPDFAIYVPNAFTPNEDDRNEVFMPVIRNAKNYNIKIYDRWGEQIFESSDLLKGWDGTYKGASCKQDVYNWKIVVSATTGEQRVMTGNVMLMR